MSEKDSTIIYETPNQKTVSTVIDADVETYQSLKAEQDRLWKEFRIEDARLEAESQENRSNFAQKSKEIEARLKQYARPECFGNLDGHLRKVSGPAQCEACDHILPCYLAQCERGRL